MCKDGKCQERAGQTRNVIISLGTAARELSKLSDHPHMVVKTPTHVAFVTADPELRAMPGVAVIMEVDPTTEDAEIARRADRYMIEGAPRSVPPLIRMLEQLLGLPPAPDGAIDEAPRSTSQASAQIA
jgi:hypothetical protein